MRMENKIRRWWAAAVAAGLLLLRLVWPGLFSGLRGLMVDERGAQAARAVFRQYTDQESGGAVRVFEEDGP